MLRHDDSIEVYHIGKAVEIGVYSIDGDEHLATAMGVLATHNYNSTAHAIVFRGTLGSSDPDLVWNTEAHYIIVTWDDERRN